MQGVDCVQKMVSPGGQAVVTVAMAAAEVVEVRHMLKEEQVEVTEAVERGGWFQVLPPMEVPDKAVQLAVRSTISSTVVEVEGCQKDMPVLMVEQAAADKVPDFQILSRLPVLLTREVEQEVVGLMLKTQVAQA
jgi:hypothetical protein